MLNLDLTKVESKEYVNFPVGKTKCWVNNIFKKTPQGGGTSFLEVKLTDGRATLVDKLYLTDKAMWRIQQFLKACQLPHKGNVWRKRTANKMALKELRLRLKTIL